MIRSTLAQNGLALSLATVLGCSSGAESEPPIEPEPEAWPEAICIDEPLPDAPLLDVVDETFVVGPYLMHTTTDAAVVMWQTETPCGAEVRYGANADALSETVSAAEPATLHELELTGLSPGERVYYQATSCNLEAEVLDFYAAPEPGSAIRFTVWGDSQSNPPQASATAAAMLQRRPTLSLHVGDTVGDGSVDQQWIDEFLVPLRPLGHHVPTYVAIGNHEGNDPNFFERVSYPESVVGEPGAESTYAFTYGNAFFLVVDTNQLFYDVDLGAGELLETPISRWIKETLATDAARTARWRFAFGHEPAITESWSPGACDNYDGNDHVRGWLFGLLSSHHFSAYFSGHTHAYERGMLDGVLHVISGGGGGGLDEWCSDVPETEVVELVHHYLEVEADCDSATVTAYRTDDDQVLDSVALEPAP
ncbi:MAG: metallophosphoesterase [Deltaproteobacteria bacterium]|nr:metallophosphoesterase [Deltaproteobacteria bacterium]MBW2530868.1 metallophosphoesterase [Deltaproteobacteria bacterium]